MGMAGGFSRIEFFRAPERAMNEMEMNKMDKARALDPYPRDPELKLFTNELIAGKREFRV